MQKKLDCITTEKLCTKSESKHTAFDKLLAQKVDFLPFLTGRDMTQMYQSSTKMRKPHVVKKLRSEEKVLGINTSRSGLYFAKTSH